MSTARHSQTGGLTQRVNETMSILLRCHTIESRFDSVFQLPMVEFYYYCSMNEASKHSLFEVSYGFHPSTHADRLVPLTGAPAPVADRLTEMASVRDVVRELLTLSKQRMVARSTRPTPIFAVGDSLFLSSKGLHINHVSYTLNPKPLTLKPKP